MTNVQEQNRRKGGRPPTGRVRKLSKSVSIQVCKSTPHALKGQKLLAQGNTLGNHGRKPVAL